MPWGDFWKDLIVGGAVVAGASLIADRLFVPGGFCCTPTIYDIGTLIGLTMIAFGLVIGAVRWAWRRSHARD